jgi:hypothetical protein
MAAANQPQPIDSIRLSELKTKFKSGSKYLPIWNTIKAEGFVIVTANTSEGVELQTIANAVERLKMQDAYFRVATELELGYQLQLDYSKAPNMDNMTIKLIDKHNKLNPINLI